MAKVMIRTQNLEYKSIEAYKSLRTNLQFCGADKKVIAITSSTPDEGKSSVTLNLAISLSEIGKKVLLIDADLRKSVLMGKTAIHQAVQGLTHYLTQQAGLEDILCTTNIENLQIAYAGPIPPNPAELLSGNLFSGMIETLRPEYDYILIDTPPLGSVIDSAIIAQNCDGAIMVIESGTISYRFAQNVKQQFEKSNCPILGAVLNKVDLSKQGYYGKYYGRYYGKYYGKYGRDTMGEE